MTNPVLKVEPTITGSSQNVTQAKKRRPTSSTFIY